MHRLYLMELFLHLPLGGQIIYLICCIYPCFRDMEVIWEKLHAIFPRRKERTVRILMHHKFICTIYNILLYAG
ncbi:hypothetical protein CGX12_18475 [Zobellella denitrificans]|nr:hypothetical protein CGX12_18475 [Zobellella denitrificans]